MSPRALVSTLVALALGAWAGDARGGGGAATDAYDGVREDVAIDVHGLLDAYEQVSLLAPNERAPLYRAFDDCEGAPSLGLARLTLAHAPEVVGFRLDVGVGDLANAFEDLDPASFAHPGLARGLSYVEQGFVTVIAPIGRGVAVDVGKFATPVGFEENEGLANWHYSRSLLFTLAEPTYHTGLRATTQATDALAISVFWLNGWNTNFVDGNEMRGFGAAASWKPSERLELTVTYLGGPERAPTNLADPALAFRNELDACALWSRAIASPSPGPPTTASTGRRTASRGGVSAGRCNGARFRGSSAPCAASTTTTATASRRAPGSASPRRPSRWRRATRSIASRRGQARVPARPIRHARVPDREPACSPRTRTR